MLRAVQSAIDESGFQSKESSDTGRRDGSTHLEHFENLRLAVHNA
jgi:hypothetical protein